MSVFNNISIICLQLFVGIHSGVIGLSTLAFLCKILATDDGQQGIILQKLGIITYSFTFGTSEKHADGSIAKSDTKSPKKNMSDSESSFDNGHLSEESL